MTEKNDDPKAWLAAQFAASGDDNPPSESEQPPSVEAASDSSRRVWSIDNDLPLRRPQLPTGSGYAWGLTPSGGQVPDAPAAGEPSSPVPPAVTSPGAPVAAVDREAPASLPPASPPPEERPLPVPIVRAFYPEPSAAATGQVPPVSPSASASPSAVAAGPTPSAAGPPSASASGGDSAQPVPSSTIGIRPAPVPREQSVANSPAEVASTTSIPTIEEVLDSPSPRRAAREAASLEAAAREAAAREATLRGESQPELTRPSDQTGEPLSTRQLDEFAPAAAVPATAPLSAEFPHTQFPVSELPNPGRERSQPDPLNAGESSHPTVTPIDDRPAPVFVDSVDEDSRESTEANAQKSRSGDTQQPGSAQQFPLLFTSTDPAAPAGDWRAGDQAADPGATDRRSSSAGAEGAPKPRNQRIVLFVLIGLVIALGLVLAANFLL